MKPDKFDRAFAILLISWQQFEHTIHFIALMAMKDGILPDSGPLIILSAWLQCNRFVRSVRNFWMN
jgi:hypothetical protein